MNWGKGKWVLGWVGSCLRRNDGEGRGNDEEGRRNDGEGCGSDGWVVVVREIGAWDGGVWCVVWVIGA